MATRDMLAYQRHYPEKKDDPELDANYRFYTNQIDSRPSGTTIDRMLREWFGDYALLERHHGYIQWLFPIRELGANSLSQPLQLHEVERLRALPAAMRRFARAYLLMLDFFGYRCPSVSAASLKPLDDVIDALRDADGHVLPSDSHAERQRAVTPHNFLRISRILKALGEFRLEHLKLPFLRRLLTDVFETRTLIGARSSAARFWVHTLRDEQERETAKELVAKYEEERATAVKKRKVEVADPKQTTLLRYALDPSSATAQASSSSSSSSTVSRTVSAPASSTIRSVFFKK